MFFISTDDMIHVILTVKVSVARMQSKQMQLAASDQDDECSRPIDYVKPANLFSCTFRGILFFKGIPFTNRTTRWNRFISIFQVMRMFMIVVIAMKNNYESRKMKAIEYVVEFLFDMYPPIEFLYLSLNMAQLNEMFENCCYRLNMRLVNSRKLVKSVRKCCLFGIVITLFGFSLLYSYGLLRIHMPNNWVIRHVFPFNNTLDHLTKVIISLVAYIQESFIKNYISCSVSLYLCYYTILIGIKRTILTNICQANSCSLIYEQLQQLDEFINCFESTLSVLPLNWLAYNIGPGLCYLFSVLIPEEDIRVPEQKIIFTIMTCWNLILVVVAFYLISKWQEDLDLQVDSFGWTVEGAIQSVLHGRMVDTVKRVVKRKVTVWHTLPIERVLILSYLSSALTFSVFLFQFSL